MEFFFCFSSHHASRAVKSFFFCMKNEWVYFIFLVCFSLRQIKFLWINSINEIVKHSKSYIYTQVAEENRWEWSFDFTIGITTLLTCRRNRESDYQMQNHFWVELEFIHCDSNGNTNIYILNMNWPALFRMGFFFSRLISSITTHRQHSKTFPLCKFIQ